MSGARTAFRVGLGLLFAGHGAQKLFGWFGGGGLAATEAEMAGLNLHPARAAAIAAGAGQLGGGAMLAAGLLTPAAGTALMSTMLTAIRTACAGKGLWAVNGGCEYPLFLTAALTAIVDEGPGELSLDRALGTEWSGSAATLTSLATASAVAAAVIAVGRAWTEGPEAR